MNYSSVPGGQPLRMPTGAPPMATPQTAQPNMALTSLLQQFHPAKQNVTPEMRMQSNQALMAQDPYQQKVQEYWASRGGMPTAPDTSKGMAAAPTGNAQAVQSPLVLAFQRMMRPRTSNMMMNQYGTGGNY